MWALENPWFLRTVSMESGFCDDLIRTNKKPSRIGNFSGRSSGSRTGPDRRIPNRSEIRAAPYSMKNVEAPSIETGTKLFVSNLDYGVSEDDIKELFSEFGELKRYSIHYDRSGRSKGTAEVVFSLRAAAAAAVKRYNNVQLDGKPIKIEMVGTNIVTPAVMPPVTNGILGNPYGVLGSGPGRGTFLGQPHGRGGGGEGGLGRGGRGRGRGRGQGRGRDRDRGERLSAEDLDADLDKYHSEAMQIN